MKRALALGCGAVFLAISLLPWAVLAKNIALDLYAADMVEPVDRANNSCGVPLAASRARDLFNEKNSNYQSSRQIVVKFLQRPLSADVGGIMQNASGGVASHVQIVAYDKATGEVFDNFGVTGEFTRTDTLDFFVESNADIERLYDKKPLGVVEMSSDCYMRVKSQTQRQLQDAYYSALNKTDLAGNVSLGTRLGGEVASKTVPVDIADVPGKIAGAIIGAQVSIDQYKGERKNYKIVSDNARQMSFPGVNCHAGAQRFYDNGKDEPTWNVIQEYVQPGATDSTSPYGLTVREDGKSRSQRDEQTGGRGTRDDVAKPSTKNPRDHNEVGVRGWCNCPNRSGHITRGNICRVGEDFNVADYSYFFCSDCHKVRKDLNGIPFLIGDGPIRIWDVSIARKNGYTGETPADDHVLKLMEEAQKRILEIPDGEVVVPGTCKCKSGRVIWRFGDLAMCKSCGRPLKAIDYSNVTVAKTRRLRRCKRTANATNVCVCKEETEVHPSFNTSVHDDGDAALAFNCSKCCAVKYMASVPMSEFRQKFGNVKPSASTIPEFLEFFIGTTDIKSAMARADWETAAN